jgi:phosphate:Na+ symporter
MLVSFVQAGLMSFSQSLGVILGADIGTTVTAQMIAFKLTDYALVMIVVGVGMRMLSKRHRIQDIGDILLGFGILFYGMKLMSDSMKPLRDLPEFIAMMKDLEYPLMGLMAGAAFTALIQSSSAFTGIIIVLAQQGLVTLEAGIPMIMGSNIGTCATALLATMGLSRDAKRVALAHVFFKIAGVLLFIFWIPDFADMVRLLTIKMGGGMARQIANAHTLFNVSIALVFLPFTTLFGWVILKILPDKQVDQLIKPATWHIDESVLDSPSLATDLSKAEIARMAKLIERMLRAAIIPFMSTKSERDKYFPQLSLTEGILMREEKIDFLQEKLTQYLIKIGRQELSNDQSRTIYLLLSIVKDIESIGDIIERNILPLINKKRLLEMDFSEEGKKELCEYHDCVCKQIQRLEKAFSGHEVEGTLKQICKDDTFLCNLESHFRLQHLGRMIQDRKESLDTHEVHMELLDYLKQINIYTSNIANKISSVTCEDEGHRP